MQAQTTTEHYKKLIEILGKQYVPASIESPFDFIHLAARGINANIINNFRTYFNIPRDTAAHMLNISEPTLYRWQKANKPLDRNSSVKLFEITDLFLYGTEVFGSKDHFFKWLALPNTALGGLEPAELIEIPGGISKVRDVLGRIAYGVYS
ncbi:MAG: type II toxin-antitoxin system Xre/ParS family antitoxin [Adhaeribacter sp.]